MSSSSRSTRPRRIAAAALGLGLLVGASSASAIERQHHLGLAPMVGILKIDDKSTASIGGGGALHYAYGLTDQWNFTAALGSAVVAKGQKQDYPEAPRTRAATVDHATVGVSYVIDILQWVPYIGVELGMYRLAGGTLPGSLFLPGANAGVGLDYQVSRHVAVGLAARQHAVTKLGTYPSYTTLMLRLEYMWGY